MSLPDFIEMVPMTGPVMTDVTVPGSKSITNRALILAALADGEVRLTGALWSEDTQIMVDALRLLGFEIAVAEEDNPSHACGPSLIAVLIDPSPSLGRDHRFCRCAVLVLVLCAPAQPPVR